MIAIKLAALNIVDKSSSKLPQPAADSTTMGKLLTDFFVVLGAIAFLMVVISGLQYIMARGNPEKITQAKNMLLYSLIGLVVAALAASIVGVVIDRVAL